MANLRPLAPAHARCASGGSMQPDSVQPGGMQPNRWDYSHLPMPLLKFVDMTDRFIDGTFHYHEIIVSIDNEHFFICSIYRYMGPNFNPCAIGLQGVDMRPRTTQQIPPEFSNFMISFMKLNMHEVHSSSIIPVAHYCPPYTGNLKVAPPQVRPYAYMKQPSLSGYGVLEDKTVIAKSVSDEAAIGEVLLVHPHPNLAKYWGCVVSNGGRIAGLVYGKYAVTLLDRVQSKIPMDKDKVMQDITAGMTHLHNLGYAHNDLSPMNIMMDANDSAVIIDFDSCTVEGGQLSKLGTPGWARPVEEMTVGTRENDLYSLEKIKTWLNKEAVPPFQALGTNDQTFLGTEA
ncbi:serine/threonine protein kinase [Fusarium flagelliforme]|uniref:Serine/threonine protein kinase n=1 Tax=Fusarium flagelliforme TaxID=2675880 RepID=A0A395MA79_9HYPO|nr:serine/threonine protein kinase [Fusarium flagelliforme]